jgi:hypothetical protein
MKNKILFSEQQKFKQPWIWIMLLALFGIIVATLLPDIIQKTDSDAVIALCIVMGLFGFLIVFFAVIRLDTMISKEGVSIKFYPFHRSFRNYKWAHIDKAVVQKYTPMRYGGWGVKSRGRTIVYNFSGKWALMLALNNGRKVLIGTQKRLELEQAIRNAEQINNKSI